MQVWRWRQVWVVLPARRGAAVHVWQCEAHITVTILATTTVHICLHNCKCTSGCSACCLDCFTEDLHSCRLLRSPPSHAVLRPADRVYAQRAVAADARGHRGIQGGQRQRQRAGGRLGQHAAEGRRTASCRRVATARPHSQASWWDGAGCSPFLSPTQLAAFNTCRPSSTLLCLAAARQA